MPIVVYVQADGTRVEVDASIGETVMTTAVANQVDGIVGDCGGGMICGTCHVFVEGSWLEVVGQREGLEDELLDGTAVESRSNSRLSCQIILDDSHDGLVVQLPESQW